MTTTKNKPIRTFNYLREAKECVKEQGFRYKGHDSYKEYKILYYRKGSKNLVITSEPHSYLNRGDMQIGTSWYVQKW